MPLTVFIPLSHTPPAWGEAGCDLKFHVLRLSVENSLTFHASIFNAWTVPLKLVPQSLNVFSGLPLLFINLCKLLMKLLVSRPSTTSKWIAQVVKQAKKAPQRFSLACICFTCIGPKKSFPVLRNGGFIASNLWSGRSFIFGCKLFACFLWHVVYFLVIYFAKTLPGIIQYFFLRLASKYPLHKWLTLIFSGTQFRMMVILW